jgi:hypothetical protein
MNHDHKRITVQPTRNDLPVRNMDYVATFDGDEEGPRGYGATPEQAIGELIEAAYPEGEES